MTSSCAKEKLIEIGVDFLGTISRLTKRNKILLLLVYVLHKMHNWAFSHCSYTKMAKKCTKKLWCVCKVVVFLMKPIGFFDILIAVMSLDLKVP